MTSIHFDSPMSESEVRKCLYHGDIFVFSPTRRSREFCDFTRNLITEAFDDDDPETAQYRMDVDRYISILAELKPKFIHHEMSRNFVVGLLRELGCPADSTYFDVPRLRSSTSDAYLTTGIAYAWHPHRDTWYSAPPSQLNAWIPVYQPSGQNTLAFHTMYFDRVVPNDSQNYNYYEWNAKHRSAAAGQRKSDTRPLPKPTEEVELDSQIRVVCPVGGIILFSGAHLHSSVPNTSGKTRFSIDFRFVNSDDVRSEVGAPTDDVYCTGSSIRDFHRMDDLSEISTDIIEKFADGSEDRGDLVYQAGEQP